MAMVMSTGRLETETSQGEPAGSSHVLHAFVDCKVCQTCFASALFNDSVEMIILLAVITMQEYDQSTTMFRISNF